jgi:type VI secretion system secreted protein Hcp
MAIGDMFLKVETARQGFIKGESNDEKHKAEIDIMSWSWGMTARTAIAGVGATGKATLDELRIVKKVDSASTALMAGLRNNDQIKKATLTVRKAGGDPLEYLKITLQDARITHVGLDSQEEEVVERVSFAFQKITVDYVPQGAQGIGGGGMSFDAETNTGT